MRKKCFITTIFILILSLTFTSGLFLGKFLFMETKEPPKKTEEIEKPEPEEVCSKTDLYYVSNETTIYKFCLNDIKYHYNELMTLEKPLEVIENEIKNIEPLEQYTDGANLYKFNDYKILICNEENKEIYIGNDNMVYDSNYCKSSKRETHTETYEVLNVEHTYSPYTYLTLKETNSFKAFVVKVFCTINLDIKDGYYYDFVFREPLTPISTSSENSFDKYELINIIENSKVE